MRGFASEEEYKLFLQTLMGIVQHQRDKNTASNNLTVEKNGFIDRIQNNENVFSGENDIGIQVINPVDEIKYLQRSEMEEQRLGAINIAELNKLYFGL